MLHIPTWASSSTFDQNGESLLGEMMVVGQHLSETHLTHRVHGNTIYEALRLVGAAGVKIQSLHKRLMCLRPYGNMDVIQDGTDSPEGFLTQIHPASSVSREELYQHLLGRDKMHGSQCCHRLQRGSIPWIA